MRLYYNPKSSNSLRVLLTAAHLGVPLELSVVDLVRGEQRAPEFLAKNPNGKVPVLEDDGLVLWESHAIMQYLADKAAPQQDEPGQDIYPTDVRARADVHRWLFWSAQHFAPAVSALSWEHYVKPLLGKGVADPEAVRRGEGVFRELGQVLDTHLARRLWIAQDTLTLADYAIASPLVAIERAKLPIAGFRSMLDWFHRIKELRAWRKVTS
jgi:glutathione S-transferase